MELIIPIIADRHRIKDCNHYAVIFPSGGGNYISMGCGKKTAWGTNSNISSTGKKSIHAEEDAIDSALANRHFRKDRTYDIIVIRVTKTGCIGLSRPCSECIIRMETCGLKIRTVYYTKSDGKLNKERLSDMYDSPLTYVSFGNRKDINHRYLKRDSNGMIVRHMRHKSLKNKKKFRNIKKK